MIYDSSESPLEHYNHFLGTPEDDKTVVLLTKLDKVVNAAAEGRTYRLSKADKAAIEPIIDGRKKYPLHPLYMGIEIEMESAHGDANKGLDETLGKVEKFAIGKRDGSLRRGVEIVSVPATLPIHLEKWPALLGEARKHYRAWAPFSDHNESTCGMHIHLDRRALTVFQLSKMLLFINDPGNSGFLTKLAGRTINQSSQYCKQISFKKPQDIVRVVRDRYQALNLAKEATIELRIFRGVINTFDFLKNVEFAHAYTYFAAEEAASNMTWKKFVYWATKPDKRGQYYHLTTWLARNYENDIHPEARKLKERFAPAPEEPKV